MAFNKARWQQVTADIFRADWCEMVVFCAIALSWNGSLKKLEALADALLEQSEGKTGARYPALIGAVLQEDPEFSDSIREKLFNRFLLLCFDTIHPPKMQLGIASALLDFAWYGTGRSRALLKDALAHRYSGDQPVQWQPHHLGIATHIHAILIALEINPRPAVEALLSHSEPDLKDAGHRQKFLLSYSK